MNLRQTFRKKSETGIQIQLFSMELKKGESARSAPSFPILLAECESTVLPLDKVLQEATGSSDWDQHEAYPSPELMKSY